MMTKQGVKKRCMAIGIIGALMLTTTILILTSKASASINWTLEKKLTDHSAWVDDTEWGPNDSVLVTTANDRWMFVYETVTWNRIASKQLTGEYSDTEFSPNEEIFAVGINDGTVDIYDTSSWNLLIKFQANPTGMGVTGVKFTPDGNYLITSSGEGYLKFWSTSTWNEREFRISTFNPHAQDIDVSPDGQYVASTLWSSQTVGVWRIDNGQSVAQLTGLGFRPNYLDFSYDGSKLAAVSEAGWFIIWNTSNWNQIYSTNLRDSGRGCEFDPSDNYIAVAAREIGIIVFNLNNNMNIECTLTGHSFIYQKPAWSNDRVRIADISNDHTVNVYKLEITLIILNNPPVAEAGADMTLIVREIGFFNGSMSYDSDGIILNYIWDFGDNTPTVDLMVAGHAFIEVGIYNVFLTVIDDDGASSIDMLTVKVITPLDAIQDLIVIVKDMRFSHGIENAMIVKLQNAIDSLIKEKPTQAVNRGLRPFRDQIISLNSEGKISDEQLIILIKYVDRIINNIA